MQELKPYEEDIVIAAIAWVDAHHKEPEWKITLLRGYLYDRVKRYQNVVLKNIQEKKLND